MICPLSEKRSRRARLGVGIQPNVYELRDGADDEGARSAVAGHGEENYLVASGGDHGSERADNAALAGAPGGGRLRRAGGPAQRGGEPEAGATGDLRKSAGVVSGKILRPEYAALSREAERRARD